MKHDQEMKGAVEEEIKKQLIDDINNYAQKRCFCKSVQINHSI